MDTSTPNDSQRRKSGRVVRKPGLLAEEQADSTILSSGSTKRKRAKPGNDDQENASDESLTEEESEDESEEEEEGEPDDEEIKEKERATKKTSTAKPAQKRTKLTNGASTTLAIRSANIPSKPASKSAKIQKARSRPSQGQQQGLYAEVFGKGQDAEDAAAKWHQKVERDMVIAMRDLINFVLQCIGCDVRIESQDIEDVDNIPAKLGDVIDEYAQKQSGEYPLTSKLKQYGGFREVLVEFFKSVIKVLHTSGNLYEKKEIYENIHVWVATMSGAGYRPFRHTATVISLSMCTAMCELAKDLQTSMSTSRTQIEAESKKKGVNKDRVASIQQTIKSDEEKMQTIDAFLNDAFDTVFVHRYRDVDEKIRVNCAAALGNWMMLYRKKFLEGQYLRYLGWVLSDTYAGTRLEVLKQLRSLYSNQRNVSTLRAFTDRFRPRIVEMGARDADTVVRAEALEVLERLRNLEMLDVEDVDTVGRLIFDIEPRIRKATAKFFTSNVDDLYKAVVDELDSTQFNSVFPKDTRLTDYLKPARSWLKFKCLAQTMSDYDKESESANNVDSAKPMLTAEETDSRVTLATEAIFSHIPELHLWESLAGLLLHDHSSIDTRKRKSDINAVIHAAYKLETREETILLDVLHNAVKLHLQFVADSVAEKRGKKSQTSKAEANKKLEAAAHQLTVVIPQLLNKFGSEPSAAALILRLEPLLNIDLISDVQGGEGSYAELLEDVNKQFVSHSDRKVLAEASRAFQTARSYDQSRPIADQKVDAIWSESASRLHTLLQGQNIDSRGTLNRAVLTEICNIMVRLASIASVSDCATAIEAQLTSTNSRKQRNKSSKSETLLDTLMQLVRRGVPDEDSTEAFAELEDQLCLSVSTVLSFYFRWKVVGLRNAITQQNDAALNSESLVELALHRSSFIEAVTPVIQKRLPLDPIRISTMLNLLDLFILFSTIKNIRPENGELDDSITTNLKSLTIDIPTDLITEILSTHEKLEKSLAKKTRRKLAVVEIKKSKHPAAVDGDENNEDEENIERPPEDSDDEADDSDASNTDNEADDGEDQIDEEGRSASATRDARKQAALMAEQSLCELASKMVLGVIAGVLNQKVKTRLQTNRTKLGKNYTQVIAYLDEKKKKRKDPKGPATAKTASPEGWQKATVADRAPNKADKSAANTPVQKPNVVAQPTRKSTRVRNEVAPVIDDDEDEGEDDDEDDEAGGDVDENESEEEAAEGDGANDAEDANENDNDDVDDGDEDDEVMGE